jgi:phenylalanyl-tRNA synthetase beta chain
VFGAELERVVVAEVRASRAHPAREKLSLVRVFDGEREHEVVCGAPNVPAPGGRVALAKLGARLPGGLEIEERKLGGVSSAGMLCSESELGIGAGQAGILVLGDDTPAAAGVPIAQALALADSVLELDLTPNRADCLGHVGVARELCAIVGAPFTPPAPRVASRLQSAPVALLPQASCRIRLPLGEPSTELPGASGFAAVRVDITDPARCPRYAAALVADVRIAPSPFALRFRLLVLGLRAINNVVDATNAILLGWGHPIHAFDYD